MNKNLWLKYAGSLSLLVAKFQAVVSLFPSASLYFGAPQGIVENRSQLFILGEGAAIIFGIFCLYAFSGAGSIRPLPLLRLGLIGISSLYLLRGLVFFLELSIVLGMVKGEIHIQGILSSLVSLVIGIVYLIGTVLNWREMQKKRNDIQSKKVIS